MTLIPRQEPASGGDRQTQLYGSLITFLVINNVVIASRVYVHYRAQYKARRSVFPEDIFALLSAVGRRIGKLYGMWKGLIVCKLCVNAIIGNLLACTFALRPSSCVAGYRADFHFKLPTMGSACIRRPSMSAILISRKISQMSSRSVPSCTAAGCKHTDKTY